MGPSECGGRANSRPNTRSVSIHIDYHRGSARRARFLIKATECMLRCWPQPHHVHARNHLHVSTKMSESQ
eukprot:COSAG02_NODE_18_length_54986_cov_345.599322_29_plen_70_part_00